MSDRTTQEPPAQESPSRPSGVERDLRSRLGGLTLRDEHRLRRRLDGLRSTRDPARRASAQAQIAVEIASGEARLRAREAAVPTITYPEQLPISQAREELAAAIAAHQVVVVAGETGSGKTTQLPKICLELGRGRRGLIGHTQPRRIAARTVAERIAAELDVPLGAAVGWKVRFTDQASDSTLVKVMTDGILLAEIQRDRDLRQYDTLIIDEAHERSLNIDFILGYLVRLLARRPELKVIITSATIDPGRFAAHFGDAPVVEVSGRTFPVEVRYRPVVDPDDPTAPERDQVDAILDAVTELGAQGRGDILVFLSGEREIRDTAEALAGADLPDTEVLPLFARLSAAEQHRVFAPHQKRRIVLATNVAETSLTVPGIRYVIDPGTARISRYSTRLKVQRLPIEAISQASANQRAGRCGRTSDGICIRLYTEDDFDARPAFTDPEILRTNLASVILQMTALGIGDVAAFPFLDPPDRRNVAAGIQLLEELGALEDRRGDGQNRLTATGRQLAQLPVDPRMARMIVQADTEGVLHEVLVITAALSIVDPRERPAEHQQAADSAHARFTDPTSDFIGLLALWRYLGERQDELSGNAFRRLCKAEFLHYLRVREWQDLYHQLRQVARGMGLLLGRPDARSADGVSDDDGADDEETPATDASAVNARGVHRALISGLLSHIGVREGARDYLGARGTRFAVFPGSALARKPPAFVVAAELVETSRLWARSVAAVDPADVEALAGPLLLRVYSEPRWDARRGDVLATEKVSLYGVPLVVARRVSYGGIDPVVSRELFIRHALVEGDWRTQHAFFAANRDTLARVTALEERARRRGIRIDDDTLFALYDARIGPEVVSGRHFDTWWKAERRRRPHLLTFDAATLTDAAAADAVDPGAYPDALTHRGLTLPLSYAFAPGTSNDGVTVQVPLTELDRLPADGLAAIVPGQRAELVVALLRSLRKDLRKLFVPVTDTATAVLPELSDGPLLEELAAALARRHGVVVPPDAWRLDHVPDHLRPTYRVTDGGRVLAEGKDVAVLRTRVAPQLARALAAATQGLERTGLTTWPDPPLPASVQVAPGGRPTTVYPALVDEGGAVAVRALRTPEAQRVATRAGALALLRSNVPSPLRAVVRALPAPVKLGLQFGPDASVPDLLEDCVRAALAEVMATTGVPVDAAAFAALVRAAREQVVDATTRIVLAVHPVITGSRELQDRLARMRGLPADVEADVRAQLHGLVHPGFVADTGARQLRELPRYLRGIAHRLERLGGNVDRDALAMSRVHAVHAEYRQLVADHPGDPAVAAIRWMLEELRISLFAQPVGTAGPVSERRIYKAMDALTA